MGFIVERANFGKYLEDIRLRHGVILEELSEGLCDCSLITKIESGERVSSMLMRDRLLERIGDTSEEYEKFVKVEEYESWKSRKSILEKIYERKLSEAKDELSKFYSVYAKNDDLEEQFYLDMMSMVTKLEGGKNAVKYAEMALQKTVKLDRDGFVVNKKLAPKEINLIIEYSAGMERVKRYEQFRRLFKYVEDNIIEERNLVLFYPKLVYHYVSGYVDDYKKDICWLFQSLEFIGKVMDCLTETHRLMYIVEITNVREKVWKYIMKCAGHKLTRGYKFFLDNKKEREEEGRLWKGLEESFNVDLSTNDWCYLYNEEGVKCIGDIIKRRRDVIGMSEETLCTDICAIETLKRIEKLKRNPQPERMRKIFERLGLMGEYQKAFVSARDSESKKCSDNVIKYSNLGDFDRALEELLHLQTALACKAPEDEQFILMIKSMIQYRRKEIDSSECEGLLKMALNQTLPKFDVSCDYYLTRNELTCMYNIIMIRGGNVQDKLESFVMELCYSMLEGRVEKDIRVLELFILAAIRIQVHKGNYDEAERLSICLIKMELKCKRSNILYSVFNVRILIYAKKVAAGGEVNTDTITKNDYYATAMRYNC